MSIIAGDVIWNITGETKDLNQALQDSERMASESFGRMVQVAGAAMTAMGASITGFQALNIKAYAESEEATKRLETVLKSTAGTIGLTKDELKGLATGLAEVTAFDDDTIVGAQSLMLTFTKIGKEIFPQATEAALDLSVGAMQDLKSSVIQLGKALNDPIAGVSALQRVGVSFTEQQKEQIKTLVETNHTLDAQKLILKELSTEFGGQARAQLETFNGQLTKIKQNFGELQEAMGKPLVEDMKNFNTELNNLTKSAAEWADAHPRVSEGLALTGAALSVGGPIAVGAGSLITTLATLRISSLLAAGAIGGGTVAGSGLSLLGALGSLTGIGEIAAGTGFLGYKFLDLANAATQAQDSVGNAREGLIHLADGLDKAGISYDHVKVATSTTGEAVRYLTQIYLEHRAAVGETGTFSEAAAAKEANSVQGTTDLIGASLQQQANAYFGLGDTVETIYNNMTGSIVRGVTLATVAVKSMAAEAAQDVSIASEYAARAESMRTRFSGIGYQYNETQGLQWASGDDWQFQNPYASVGAGFGVGVIDLIRSGAKPGGPGVGARTPEPLPTPLPTRTSQARAAATEMARIQEQMPTRAAGPSVINVNVSMRVGNVDVDVKSDLERVSRDIGSGIVREIRRQGIA